MLRSGSIRADLPLGQHVSRLLDINKSYELKHSECLINRANPDLCYEDDAFREFITSNGFKIKTNGKIIVEVHCANCNNSDDFVKFPFGTHFDDNEDIIGITCLFYRGIFTGGELTVYTRPQIDVRTFDTSNENKNSFKYVIIRGDIIHRVNHLYEGMREVLCIRVERQPTEGDLVVEANKKFIETMGNVIDFSELSPIFNVLLLEKTFFQFKKYLSYNKVLTFVSLGSGNAAFESLLSKYVQKIMGITIDFILIDPSPLSWSDGKLYIKPHYSSYVTMLDDRPDLYQNCFLLLNCIDPNTEPYDFNCVIALKPRAIFFITNTTSTTFYSGSSVLKYYLDNPAIKYHLINRYQNSIEKIKEQSVLFYE